MNIRPESLEEKAVWVAIVGTYAFWLAGALYLLAPALGWLLAVQLLSRRLTALGSARGAGTRLLPVTAWAWIACMSLMALALFVAHADFGLGIAQTVKSFIGWAKGWALLALFIVIGCLSVRPELLYRAACVLGAQTLVVLPLMVLGYLLHLPEVLYVSPLEMVGGPGPEFFDVSIYSINPDNGTPRWRLFTPWGPALGFVGNIYFFLSLAERERHWRAAGLAGALAMILVSGSRLGLLAVLGAWVLSWGLSRLSRPGTHFALAGATLLAGLTASPIIQAVENFIAAFNAVRADSSRVRATLGRLALERWWNEAIVWGHGIVERGPHLVEFMPIGSHHSWYGLLFVKGIVGALALAVALSWTLINLVVRAQSSAIGKVALQLCLLLFFYTFGENLEILSYLYWPGLVMIGIALRQRSPAPQPI